MRKLIDEKGRFYSFIPATREPETMPPLSSRHILVGVKIWQTYQESWICDSINDITNLRGNVSLNNVIGVKWYIGTPIMPRVTT